MPKFVDYPRGSLKNALVIGNAVQELGGSCTMETCADHLGKKVSGSFRSQVSSAVKYKFIAIQKGMLIITAHFKKLSLAYDEKEKIELLQESFFNIPVFKAIYERFVNGKLPVNTLDRILIREFEVPNLIAGRIANYFVDAAKEANLINTDNSFIKVAGYSADPNVPDIEDKGDSITTQKELTPRQKDKEIKNYLIRIIGPGIQFEKEINSEDDFLIVDAIIQNIKKQIMQKSKDE